MPAKQRESGINIKCKIAQELKPRNPQLPAGICAFRNSHYSPPTLQNILLNYDVLFYFIIRFPFFFCV